jgi:hypothetical protein
MVESEGEAKATFPPFHSAKSHRRRQSERASERLKLSSKLLKVNSKRSRVSLGGGEKKSAKNNNKKPRGKTFYFGKNLIRIPSESDFDCSLTMMT